MFLHIPSSYVKISPANATSGGARKPKLLSLPAYSQSQADNMQLVSENWKKILKIQNVKN